MKPTVLVKHLPIILLLWLAFIFRTGHLDLKSLNADESRVLTGYIDEPLTRIFVEYKTGNQVFYHFLMWSGAYISHAPYFLRFVTATIFSMLAIPLLYALAVKWYNRRVAWLSAALLALSTNQIYYAQELRGYALIVMCSILGTYLLYSAMEKPSWIKWLAFGLVSVVNVYTHLFAGAMLAAQVVMMAWYWGWHRSKSNRRPLIMGLATVGLTGLVIVGLYSPLVWQILSFSSVEQNYGSDFTRLADTSLVQQVREYVAGFSEYVAYSATNAVTISLFLLFLAALALSLKAKPYQTGWLFIWIFAPYLLALLVLNSWPSFFLQYRFLIFQLPALLLALVAGAYFAGQSLARRLAGSARRQWAAAMTWGALLTIVALFGLANYRSHAATVKIIAAYPWPQAANFLIRQATPQDVILCEKYNAIAGNIINPSINLSDECYRNISWRMQTGETQFPFIFSTLDQLTNRNLFGSELLAQPIKVWVVRWDIPADIKEGYPAAATFGDLRRVDIIAANQGSTLFENLLYLTNLRTGFQEDSDNKAVYWFQLARMYQFLGDTTNADNAMQQLRGLPLANPALLDNLAEIYASEAN